MGPDDTIYCTDDGDHTRAQMHARRQGAARHRHSRQPAPFMSGAAVQPLHPHGAVARAATSTSPTATATRACTNTTRRQAAHVVGRAAASAPGEFNLPHNIGCDADGWVYVADRENHRVQVFDGNGKFETQWHNLHRPSGLHLRPASARSATSARSVPIYGFNRGTPNLGPRVSVLDHKGNLLARLGKEPLAGTDPGQFLSPHGLAVDSRGDLYVGEVAVTAWPSLFPEADAEADPESSKIHEAGRRAMSGVTHIAGRDNRHAQKSHATPRIGPQPQA